MLKYNLDIDKKSKWYIAPETNVAKKLPFYLTESGDFFCGKSYFTERDYKDGYLLLYTISGSGLLKTKNQEKQLLPQRAVIFNCNTYHKYESTSSNWHFIWMHINGTGTKAYEELINDNSCEVIKIVYQEDFLRDIEFVVNFSSRHDIISCVQISDTISRIMSSLITQHLSGNLQVNKFASHYVDINEVIDFIKKNYHEQISLNNMTESIKISKYHFARLFKAQMGTTPYEYLVNFRIYQAKIQLRTTQKAIYEIAQDVGYLSVSNFINQFKNIVGMTPAKYRSESIIS